MKAIVQERFGPPEVLRLVDLDLPVLGADDVLVRKDPGRAAAPGASPPAMMSGLDDVGRRGGRTS